jgi:hypothetical protein
MVSVTRYKMPCGLPPSATYEEYAAAVVPPDPIVEVPLNPLNPSSYKVGAGFGVWWFGGFGVGWG